MSEVVVIDINKKIISVPDNCYSLTIKTQNGEVFSEEFDPNDLVIQHYRYVDCCEQRWNSEKGELEKFNKRRYAVKKDEFGVFQDLIKIQESDLKLLELKAKENGKVIGRAQAAASEFNKGIQFAFSLPWWKRLFKKR